jgi:hypothetical protein
MVTRSVLSQQQAPQVFMQDMASTASAVQMLLNLQPCSPAVLWHLAK